MKILSVVGARPNFIKMSPLIETLKTTKHEHTLVHTGQHYDFNMFDVFFKEMNLKKPDYNLGVGSGSHGFQTGEILKKVEKVILKEEPDVVVVPGDTNSNLSGALAAAKIHIKVAHIEAGLRSFDKKIPEEINRIIIDHCSNLLFCPTKVAIRNLKREGITKGVHLVGDTMYELAIMVKDRVEAIKPRADLPREYILSTIHRACNTINKRLKRIIEEMASIDKPIVLPLHPRTKKKLAELGLLEKAKKEIIIINPVGFLEFTSLLKGSIAVLTDSGGVQKEAYWNKKPCITIRDTTEWVETIEANGNILAEPEEIKEKIDIMLSKNIIFDENLYGYNDTSKRILKILEAEID